MHRIVCAAAMAAVAGVTAAQSRAAPEPAFDYRSAFDDYRPWSSEAPRDWRGVNDEMRRLGGHVGHLRGKPVAGAWPDALAPRTNPPARPAQSPRQDAPGRTK